MRTKQINKEITKCFDTTDVVDVIAWYILNDRVCCITKDTRLK